MLIKSLILATAMVFSSVSAAPAKPPAEKEAPSEVPQEGMWADGTTLYWLCEPGMKGRIRIMVVAPNGAQYPAEIECISPSAKQI